MVGKEEEASGRVRKLREVEEEAFMVKNNEYQAFSVAKQWKFGWRHMKAIPPLVFRMWDEKWNKPQHSAFHTDILEIC